MAFLTDYRSGAIGRVSLETPASRRAMTAVEEINTKPEPVAELIVEITQDIA